jgi:GNAT superfamily N-acetyltransferase
VGAALLEAVMRHAQQRNCRAVMVNVGRASAGAAAFYAALGFQPGQFVELRLR